MRIERESTGKCVDVGNFFIRPRKHSSDRYTNRDKAKGKKIKMWFKKRREQEEEGNF